MWLNKKEKYRPYFGELAGQGVVYIPIVLSCYGRLHPEAAVVLDRLALQAGRRQGVSNHLAMLRRAKAALGVAVVTRQVAMARACLPTRGQSELQLLYGEAATGDDYYCEGAVP